jgi:hypothetical protein
MVVVCRSHAAIELKVPAASDYSQVGALALKVQAAEVKCRAAVAFGTLKKGQNKKHETNDV